MKSPAPWAGAIRSKRHADRRLPQTVAHRGYKAKYPENSMAAFRGAADVGAHAIETDVHLSSDGVVVLSHVSILSSNPSRGAERTPSDKGGGLIIGRQLEEVFRRGPEDRGL